MKRKQVEMAHPENNRVLVRFHTNSSTVRDELVSIFGLGDVELEKRSRDLVRRINESRQEKARKAGLKQARPGMLGDTGEQVFGKKGLPNTTLAELHSDLLACGFILIGGSIVQSPRIDQETGHFTETNKQKWTVSVEYHLPGEGLEQNVALVQRVEAYLASRPLFQLAHVWDNPDGSATVNVINEQEGKAKKTNVLRYHPRHGFRTEDTMPPQMSLRAKLEEKLKRLGSEASSTDEKPATGTAEPLLN